MKRSDLEKHIEEIITELLDEGELKIATPDGTSKTATSSQRDQAKKALQNKDSVEFQKSTEAP